MTFIFVVLKTSPFFTGYLDCKLTSVCPLLFYSYSELLVSVHAGFSVSLYGPIPMEALLILLFLLYSQMSKLVLTGNFLMRHAEDRPSIRLLQHSHNLILSFPALSWCTERRYNFQTYSINPMLRCQWKNQLLCTASPKAHFHRLWGL